MTGGNENVQSWRRKIENGIEDIAVSVLESSPQKIGERL